VQDVLYVGELDARRLVKQPTNLNAFVDKCLRVYRVAAQEKGIGLTLTLPEQVLTAALHRGKFGRVLDNLLSNALKFTPPGGHVRVGLAEHRGRARLTVHDTGIGIPEPLQALVFDKFSTAVRAGLYGATTTGLGLFITKQIVQQHGGKIWLESRENDGTTFTIELV
jgi:two-component system sensor histidine kinase VicK